MTTRCDHAMDIDPNKLSVRLEMLERKLSMIARKVHYDIERNETGSFFDSLTDSDVLAFNKLADALDGLFSDLEAAQNSAKNDSSCICRQARGPSVTKLQQHYSEKLESFRSSFQHASELFAFAQDGLIPKDFRALAADYDELVESVDSALKRHWDRGHFAEDTEVYSLWRDYQSKQEAAKKKEREQKRQEREEKRRKQETELATKHSLSLVQFPSA